MIDRIRNYRITDEIGSGGMAVVYKGIQEPLGRVVAIKALKTSLSKDENIVARFEREALSVASFQHENIITLYDYFREGQAMFMVMEFVEGIDLYDLLERSQRIPAEVAAMMALQLARALDYAHFRGIIHRDVKPANVILSKYGEVKLTDFGIARTQESDLTQTGIGLGTPAYMSPEQIVGDPLDHRSDIWSLGVVMYQVLTGQKPFVDTEKRSALQRIRLEEPTPIRRINKECPKELETIIAKCIKKSAKDRYGSAQELVVALEHYLALTVQGNYRARLVRFMREQSVISDDETSAMLHPALIGDYVRSNLTTKVPLPARYSLRTLVPAAVGALLLAGVAGFLVARSHISAAQVPSAGGAMMPTFVNCGEDPGAPVGYLRVLAHPWAHVSVDGKKKGTTPFGKPLKLTTGKHTLRFENPYFEQVEREVKIERGLTASVSVALKRRGKASGEEAASR